MAESFKEYFDTKGAVGIFCIINPVGSRFEELLAALPISRKTLDTRLKEGSELGLVTKETIKGRTNSLGLWVPTERGMEVYEELRARQIPPRFKEYRDSRREFEEEKEAFVKYVERKEDSDWEDLESSGYSHQWE
jgi:DNA-binding HxlR family transcriptional regulator